MLKNDVNIYILSNDNKILSTLKNILKVNYPSLCIFTNTDPMKAYEEVTKNEYEIIIIDNIIPYMDGIKFTEKIYRKYTPKVILIGGADVNVTFLNVLYPVPYVISRNFDVEELICILNTILGNMYVKNDRFIKLYIDKIINEINISGRLQIKLRTKNFLKKIFYILVTNNDFNGSLYKYLAEYLNENESTIKQRCIFAVKRIDDDSFKKLGFNKKPTTVKFFKQVKKNMVESIYNRI